MSKKAAVLQLQLQVLISQYKPIAQSKVSCFTRADGVHCLCCYPMWIKMCWFLWHVISFQCFLGNVHRLPFESVKAPLPPAQTPPSTIIWYVFRLVFCVEGSSLDLKRNETRYQKLQCSIEMNFLWSLASWARVQTEWLGTAHTSTHITFAMKWSARLFTEQNVMRDEITKCTRCLSMSTQTQMKGLKLKMVSNFHCQIPSVIYRMNLHGQDTTNTTVNTTPAHHQSESELCACV